jgi:hypothetical protein
MRNGCKVGQGSVLKASVPLQRLFNQPASFLGCRQGTAAPVRRSWQYASAGTPCSMNPLRAGTFVLGGLWR